MSKPELHLAAGGGGIISPLDPGSAKANAPGFAGFVHLTNILSLYALLVAVIVIILGGLLAALGPRLGFHRGRELGMGGVVGGIALAAVDGLAVGLVNAVYAMFGG